MIVVRFSNEMTKSLELVVEPWATQVTVPAGSKFAVHYSPPENRPDTSYAEVYEDMVKFWCEGDAFEVELNGKLILT
jgi:hypothetical protein